MSNNKELNMTTDQIYQVLKNLTPNDVIDFGENYEGQNVFAIKSPYGTCSLTINSLEDIKWEE